MAKKKVTQVVAEMLEPFLNEEGYELYHSEFVKEGGDWFLRVYIDKGDEEHVSTDDCEKVSRYLSEKLDEEDPIQQNYYLEVSSPGMDRPLIEPDHYRKALGKAVEVKLYKSKDGSKVHEGTLSSADAEKIVLTKEDGSETTLEMTEIAKAKLVVTL